MAATDAPVLEPPADREGLEDAAIAFVIEQEAAAGRTARDIRGRRLAAGHVESGERIVEVVAVATTLYGRELWLEPHQYEAARAHPDRFWLYVVENVGQGDPARFRLTRLGGERLQRLLGDAVKHRFYTVPMPGAVHDAVVAEG